VVFLSDICEDHHLVIRDRLSFSERVTEGVLSCRVGACKPDARMYEAFESRFCNGGVPCLYLDDRRDNVEAARQRGWPVHRFTGTEDAEQALVEAIRLLSGRDG
jgi:FMN phosphatase YigB (HAD superfamily)